MARKTAWQRLLAFLPAIFEPFLLFLPLGNEQGLTFPHSSTHYGAKTCLLS